MTRVGFISLLYAIAFASTTLSDMRCMRCGTKLPPLDLNNEWVRQHGMPKGPRWCHPCEAWRTYYRWAWHARLKGKEMKKPAFPDPVRLLYRTSDAKDSALRFHPRTANTAPSRIG